jgi:hypothetical protein
MNHEGKRPANDHHFMIYDSLFDILRFSSNASRELKKISREFSRHFVSFLAYDGDAKQTIGCSEVGGER